MNAQSMIAAAYKQQQLTGRKDADVSFIISGKWPEGQHKRLNGRKGPLGRCIAEYEDAVLCLFKANEVVRYCSQFLPVLEIPPDFLEQQTADEGKR